MIGSTSPKHEVLRQQPFFTMRYTLDSAAIQSPQQLETARLKLLPVSEELREFVFRGLSDKEVRHQMKMPLLDTPASQQEWWDRFEKWRSNGEVAQWCAFLKDTGEYAGLFTIKEISQAHYRGEIGYSIMKEFWGKGLGAEGAKTLVEYAFGQIGLHTLCAMILPYNIPSQRIVKRLGFEQEAYFRQIHFYEGEFYDVIQFSVINPNHSFVGTG